MYMRMRTSFMWIISMNDDNDAKIEKLDTDRYRFVGSAIFYARYELKMKEMYVCDSQRSKNERFTSIFWWKKIQ